VCDFSSISRVSLPRGATDPSEKDKVFAISNSIAIRAFVLRFWNTDARCLTFPFTHALSQSTSKSDKFSFTIEAAHKKGTGSVKNGRDSNPKYRGVKLYGQEKCRAGNIIVRQLGNKFHAGPGVGTGKDFTLFALRDGEILFKKGAGKKQFVCVVDAVDRSAEVSRKTKRRELYTPRSSAAVESR